MCVRACVHVRVCVCGEGVFRCRMLPALSVFGKDKSVVRQFQVVSFVTNQTFL